MKFLNPLTLLALSSLAFAAPAPTPAALADAIAEPQVLPPTTTPAAPTAVYTEKSMPTILDAAGQPHRAEGPMEGDEGPMVVLTDNVDSGATEVLSNVWIAAGSALVAGMVVVL